MSEEINNTSEFDETNYNISKGGYIYRDESTIIESNESQERYKFINDNINLIITKK